MAAALAVGLFTFGTAAAQDGMKMKMGEMGMGNMPKDGHQAMMMAYHENAVAFAKIIWALSSDGKIQDVDLARTAFAELKRSVGKMDEVHQIHMTKMGKMSPEMLEKMKPMMEKLNAEKALTMGHIDAIEKALRAAAPNSGDVEMHSAALVMQFEKMKMPSDKMKM